jgi:hypothetical protein
MSLMFKATASKSETFFVRPVASRTNTGDLEVDKKNEIAYHDNFVFMVSQQ